MRSAVVDSGCSAPRWYAAIADLANLNVAWLAPSLTQHERYAVTEMEFAGSALQRAHSTHRFHWREYAGCVFSAQDVPKGVPQSETV